MRKREGVILVLLLGIFLASFVSAESGMVVFQNSTAAFLATPQYDIWNETVFSPTYNATAVTGTLRMTVLKNNPVREEIILGTLDSNSDIKVQFYNSTSNWSSISTMTANSGVSAYRAYDIAIEKASGDVMVAYNNNVNGNISYQVWNGSSWYKTGTVTTNLTAQTNWINLVADRDDGVSNHIIMIASDANSRLIAMEWNGTSWSNSYLLETTLEVAIKEDFSVSYENSGDALIVWADAATASLRSITFTDSVGIESSVPASAGQTADFQWVRAVNYPNSDRIMVCSVDAGADFNCIEWTGSGWGSVTEITAAGEYSEGASFRNFDIVPDTSSGGFVLMYGLNNNNYFNIIRCFGQANCQAGAWEATQSFFSGVDMGGDTAWASLSYDPENIGKITAVMISQSTFREYIARISCTNSANSCAADQTSTLLSTTTSGSYESAMFTYFGRRPNIANITTITTTSPSTLMTIAANGVNDTNFNSLDFYCSINSNTPTVANTICTGGNTTGVASPYTGTSCLFTSQVDSGTYRVFCRVYDGDLYSIAVNTSYVVSSSAPITSVVSVAGDSIPSYFDTVAGDGTLINISGETGMTCKWATTDLAYSGMSNACTTNGIYASCNITGISTDGFYTRYVACANSLGIGQSASQNLDVGFFLDLNAPTTSDNSNTNLHVPPYIVTLTEGDAVDTDPFTLYCVDTVGTCTPNIGIDNLGQVTFTTRGRNYFRYNSSDDAGNKQVVKNVSININLLPTFTSAVDNSTNIKGGDRVLISTISLDIDAVQNLTLYVCNSSGANSSGCTNGITSCTNNSDMANISCSFNSESDTVVHTWYAYIFDELGEAATTNPLTGFYSTDFSGPTITINDPQNTTYTQSSISAQITTSEAAGWAGYSLDGAANVSMTNLSSMQFTATISGLSLGLHNITYYANDSFGNMGVSVIKYFTIAASLDLVAPIITIVTPSNLSYTTLTPLLNITTDETLRGAGYKLNGGSLITMTNTSLTSWNATLSLSQETTNTIIIYANDTSNNQANRTIVIYADSLAPRYSSVSAPSANQSLPVNCSIAWVDGFSLTNVIIGENSSGSFENHTISLTSNGTASYLIVGSKLANAGNYMCIFYARDAAGNANSTSKTFTISDVTAPVVTVTSPGNFTYNQNSIGISLVTNENASSAWYSLNGGANISMGNTSKTNWNATLTSLSNVQYNIKFYANDSSGNVGNSSLIYFTVNYFSDLIPPVITIVNPINLSFKGLSEVLNISSNEALLWAGYKLNGGNLTNLTNTSLTSWNATLSGLAQESTNTLVIYANDTSSPNNQANSTIIFYSDTLAPRYSNPLAPSANQSQSVNCSIVWNDAFALTNVIIGENSSGSFENHTISLTSNGTASYLIVGSKLANKGNYTCEFYASDVAGNKAYNSITFSINDITVPVVTVTSPSAGTYNQIFIPLSLITSENASSAWYYLNSTGLNQTMGNTSKINWNATLSVSNGQAYSIIFYANDSSGNVGSSLPIVFIINTGLTDTIPPVVTVTSIANASYKGLSNIPLNITVNENVSWVNYSLNGATNVSMTNTSMFNWNATFTGLTQESTNNLTVYANDTAGNIGSSRIVFYADTLAPRFSFVNATSVNENQNVNCTVYVNDTFNLSSVKISENTTGSFVNHTIDLFSAGYANYTIYNVAKGVYNCTFYAIDLAGNTNLTSTTFGVSDITAPNITVTSPSNATYGDSSIAASIVTSEAVSSAGYSLNGGITNVIMSNTSLTSWGATLGALGVGIHNITFYANDSSGNKGSSSLIYFTVAVTDSVPPVLSSTLINASYKNSAIVLFNVSSNENLVWAGYTFNGSALTNLSNISTVLWNGTLTGFASGSTNTLVIYGNDSSGNQGNSTIIFYFDNQSPQFSSVSATSVNENQNVNCTVYVNDTFNLSSVKISENTSITGFVNHTIDLFSAGYANYTIYNVAKGNYTCIFYATDAAGNINYTSKNFGVADVTAPTITIINPQNQTYNTDNISLSVVTSEAAALVRYSSDGSANISMTNSSTTIWSGSLTSLSNGLHTVVYYANDSSGNLGTANISFTVDTTLNDNAKPLITIWSPLNASYSTNASVLLNITSDKNLSWAGYTNNSGALVNLTNSSLIDWSSTVTFAEGNYTLVFYANDTRTVPQNQGNKTVLIYVDLNAPSANLTCNSSVNDSENLVCNASAYDFIGLDYAILSYNFSGSFVNSSHIDLSGSNELFSYTFGEGNYTPGSYSVQLYLFDLSGRVNSSASKVVQVLDDTAPVIINVSYSPTMSEDLDPDENVTINASVSDNYAMGSVKVYYKNISESSWIVLDMTNTTLEDYNATIPAIGEGNFTFYINATDGRGNTNISRNYTLEVYPDISQNIATNISVVESFTYAQRTSSNLLGYIILNDTSDDTNLNYSVTISADSSILGRFNLNNTMNQTENYSANHGEVLYVPLYINLIELTANPYLFNITVISEAGTVIIERTVIVQEASGPYLSISIDTYSSRVTQGETGVTFSATVTNLGTADAQGVYLNWSLPTGFILVSGSLERSLTTLPVGVSATNTITIDALSNLSSNLTITALASSINADSASASKVVIVTNPITITQLIEVPGQSTGGGGGGGAAVAGGGGGAAVTYFKTIEVVRGNRTSFTIDFGNTRVNKTLTNVVMSLTGFPEKYIQISPNSFSNVYYGENKSFEVLLNAPTYKSYEEHILKVVIKGTLVSGNSQESYTETQNIRLIIQEISHEAAAQEYNLANSSINDMKQKGYNTAEMEQLYNQARNKLDVDFHNKESYDISAKIIGIKETAYKARKLIDTIRSILTDPDNINLLTGNAVNSDGTQNVIFYSKEIGDILDMADSAFERGDYTTALERAQKAELILRLEQKGNVLVFFYLYWPQMLFALVVLLILGKIVYSKYSKNKVSSKIKDLNREEENINSLMTENQNKYYSGKISSSEYHARANQYHNRLANLRKSRINLRNKRIKVLAPEEFAKELDGEKKEVEQEVMKIQKSYYKTKNLSEEGYKSEFNLLNNRLAEIEDERIVVDVNKTHEESKKKGFFSSFFAGRKARKEQELKSKIDNLLKSKERVR